MDDHARIATWNLWSSCGSWKERQTGIGEALGKIAPDIVGLQEVWHDADAAQASILADRLGLAHMGELRSSHRPSDGLAILSRWPISDRLDIELPTLGRSDGDGSALSADIRHPDGLVRLVVAHLAWRLDDGAVRRAQLREIACRARTMPASDGLTVLVGDLNAPPDADEIRMLTGRSGVSDSSERRPVFRDAWEAAGRGPGHTWSPANHHVAPERDPASRIDYVFVEWRPDEPGRIHAAELFGDEPIDGLFPSDHFGVVADVKVGRCT